MALALAKGAASHLECDRETDSAAYANFLAARNLLGAELAENEQHTEAVVVLREVLAQQIELAKDAGGGDGDALSPAALQTHSNLAASLMESPETIVEATALLRSLVAKQTKLLGAGDEDTLITLNNLAYCLDVQGMDKEAEVMHRGVLDAREKLFGADHEMTMGSMQNLAQCLEKQASVVPCRAVQRSAEQ